LVAFATHRTRLLEVLVSHSRSTAPELLDLAGRLCLGRASSPPGEAFTIDLLTDLVKNYEGWEERHFVPEVGLFWQTGHDDGMEFNINSRQTRDILRGAPSYRPSFNAYMWADALAIAKIAEMAKEPAIAARFVAKATALKAKMLELLWDERRQFFFPVFKNDEERDGFQIKALTKTYESGQFAGSPYGRELIGYVPWQFRMLPGESRFEIAWKKLMDRDGFYADFGPSTVERNDPLFLLQKSCCWWSGQSWPYATTQTLKALANLLQEGSDVLSSRDYLQSLQIYARSHRKDGKPYLAEALHPDTGSFEGHDAYNHSEHYLHSGYCDLVITGLVGLIPRDDGTIEVNPLAPADWDYFALDDVPYRGRMVSVLWDKTGSRYGRGAGLRVLIDGKLAGSSPQLERLLIADAIPSPASSALGPSAHRAEEAGPVETNFVVNNDGTFYPRLTASHTAAGTSLAKLNDGNYWYLVHPPNRWTTAGSDNDQDWITVDFGTSRSIHTVKLYILDDSEEDASRDDIQRDGESQTVIRAPQEIQLEAWIGDGWVKVSSPQGSSDPESVTDKKGTIQGRRPYIVSFPPLETSRLRVTLSHQPGHKSGLTELEAWGDAILPLAEVPPPAGNLAYNPGDRDYPRASASYSDRFGGQPPLALDGITNFLATPVNRWTCYESPTDTDWLEVDFGTPTEFRRVELAIYDDRGGVQVPASYQLQVWTGSAWQDIESVVKSPAEPLGSQWNSASFAPVTSSKVRIIFTHRGRARSGVSEVMVWNE
jgi:hypothetical protein